jgi:hypothetical protein
LILNKEPIVIFKRNCHVTEKSEAIACARRSWSSRLKCGESKKKNRKSWRDEEEVRHKGSLAQKRFRYFRFR